MFEKYLRVSDEVKEALKNGQPVVALESTIISHGMPYPKNVETALEVEAAVREAGAIPATICIIGGKIVVGASKEDIEYLAHTCCYGNGNSAGTVEGFTVLQQKDVEAIYRLML